MSNNSKFSLVTQGEVPSKQLSYLTLHALIDHESFDSLLSGDLQHASWDSQHVDMLTISRLFLGHLFTVEQVDHYGDSFQHYYKNGEMETVEQIVIFPETTL